MKLCLHFSVHAFFLAVKHKQLLSSKNGDSWRSSTYFNELQKEGKAKYKRKLTLTYGQLLPDLHGTVENMKSNVKLMHA